MRWERKKRYSKDADIPIIGPRDDKVKKGQHDATKVFINKRVHALDLPLICKVGWIKDYIYLLENKSNKTQIQSNDNRFQFPFEFTFVEKSNLPTTINKNKESKLIRTH